MFQALKNIFWHQPLSLLARAYYLFPDKKLTIIGITGTDGKTTTAHLIYHVLKNANLPVSLISTIEARIGDQVVNTGLHTTSPDKFKTFNLIRQISKSGSKYLVAEVTAHGIDQHRFANIIFDIGIITNTSHEHLDDFKTIKKYILTKVKLLKNSKIAIINKDDDSYSYSNLIKSKKIFYSRKVGSTYQAKNIRLTPDSLSFNCHQTKFVTDSIYEYQIYNILAAYIACKKLKIKDSVFLDTIKNFPEVKGRRQHIDNSLGFKTIVDFAHTPKALTETLKSLKKQTKNRLIVIFGATGGRDKTKRPAMGLAVSKYADIALITADDTRLENIRDINNQIISGIPKNCQFLKSNQTKSIDPKRFTYFDIVNRQDAFNLAVKIALPGDTIVACGKGHETTILHGKTDYPWSEAEAFRTAFKLKK